MENNTIVKYSNTNMERRWENDNSQKISNYIRRNKYVITYSEIANAVYGKDIDFFYTRLEAGLTDEECEHITRYVDDYRPRPLDVNRMDVSACYDLIAGSIQQLRKDWEHNCAQRARGCHPEQTEISTSYLVKLIRENMAWELLGLSDKDAVDWMLNIQKKVFKTFNRYPNYHIV